MLDYSIFYGSKILAGNQKGESSKGPVNIVSNRFFSLIDYIYSQGKKIGNEIAFGGRWFFILRHQLAYILLNTQILWAWEFVHIISCSVSLNWTKYQEHVITNIFSLVLTFLIELLTNFVHIYTWYTTCKSLEVARWAGQVTGSGCDGPF